MRLIDESDVINRLVKETEDSGRNVIHINTIKNLLSDVPAYRVKKDILLDLRVKEVMVNLRNYDFDVLGDYKMDEKEAKKLLEGLESLFARKGISTEHETNADRIRDMTNEELAEFLCEVKSDYQWADHEFPSEDACGDWEEWLESECD